MGSGMGGLLAGGGADMGSMMSDPKFLDSAMSMMRGMDEESLTSMMISSGMCASKEQAHAMAKQVGAVHGEGYLFFPL